MSEKIKYWKWKSTIIDFDNIKDEKADFGDYWTKKEMVFHYLGCPDDKIHEWYNGGWSCEYNFALEYAKELGLVEDYIDYDIILYEKDKEIERLNNIINEFYNWLKEKVERFKEDECVSVNIEHERLAIKMIYHYFQSLKEENK